MYRITIDKRRILFRGLMAAVTIFTILAYSSAWGVVFASDSAQDLPSGTVQLTPAIPGMGEHWANDADMPLGPIYLVYQGEVIGIEFMYSQDMLGEVTIPTPEGEEIFHELANLAVNHRVDHFDVAFLDHGHEGFEAAHWDIHAYYVSHAEHLAIPPAPEPAVKEITINAKKFEYEPNTITVNLGDIVRLKITAEDIAHGFALPEFGIIKVELDPDKIVEVEFVADKKGTFDFRCVVRCGSGHSNMKGKLVVE